jgi:hypothetical protein
MKRTLATVLLALAAGGAAAQSIWPDALGGAALGAGLGALIGGSSGGCGWNSCHNNGNAGQGAAIGAGIGLVAGTLFGLAKQQEAQYAPPPTAWAYTPVPVEGYGYAPAYTPAPGYYTPAPAAARPNYALGGTLVGAASGALIGQGVSGKPGVGAAIGAGSGLVLGSLAEVAARSNPPLPPVGYTPPPPAPTQAYVLPPRPAPRATPPAVPAPVYYAAAPRHQIPDAPLVPSAPTF